MLSHNEHYAVSCVLISGNLIVQLLHMFQPVFAERHRERNLLSMIVLSSCYCYCVSSFNHFSVLIIFPRFYRPLGDG